MKKIKRFIDTLHVKLLIWHQKVFDPFPDLLEEAKEVEEMYKADNVIDARYRFLKNLRDRIKKQNEKYCEHCGLPIDECPGYKCWM